MKGNTYTTPNGNTHKVLMFDEINKMAYIHLTGGHHRWVHESEYSTWTINDTAEMPKIYVPDIPAQMTEEQINSQSKTENDAIQEFSGSGILQHSQEGAGEEGGERERMEQGEQGDESTKESKVESKEKVKKPRTKKIKE